MLMVAIEIRAAFGRSAGDGWPRFWIGLILVDDARASQQGEQGQQRAKGAALRHLFLIMTPSGSGSAAAQSAGRPSRLLRRAVIYTHHIPPCKRT